MASKRFSPGKVLLWIFVIAFAVAVGSARADGAAWAGVVSAVVFTVFLVLWALDFAAKRRRKSSP